MDDDAGLGAELAAVVEGARRRAVRDGDRQTDTAHLLHSLLEHDPEVRVAVGGPARLTRLLGYLVQRSIGYGLRWQSSVEGSGAIPGVEESGAITTFPAPAPAAPAVRSAPAAPAAPAAPVDRATTADQAVTAAHGTTAGRATTAVPTARGGAARDGGNWSPVAAAALAEARERARRRGDFRVTGTDLFAALLMDPQSRAVEVLGRAGIAARDLLAPDETGGECAGDDGVTF